MINNGETIVAVQHENEILKAEVTQLRQRIAELEEQAITSAQTIDFFSMLFDTIPTPIFYKDVEGVYRGCNTAFATMLGHPRTHIIGKTVYDIAPSELAQRYHQADLELIQRQSLQTYEAEVMHADGTSHYMSFYKVVFADEHGKPAGLIGVMLDLTIRKRVEEEVQYLATELEKRVAAQTATLKKQQRLLQAIIDGVPAVLVVRDTEGHCILANHNTALVLGQSPEAIIGKKDEEVFPPAWVETQKHQYQHVLKTGQSSEQEMTLLLSDQLRTFLVYHFPVCDEHGDAYAVGSIGLDITERKDTERDLYDNEQLLKTLFEHLPVAVLVKEAREGRFVLWNHTCEELLGLRAEQVIGKTDHDFFPPDQADFFRQKDLEVLAGGVCQVIPEEPIDSQVLGLRIIRTIKVPIYNDQNEPRHLLVIFNDITDQKRAAEERAALQEQIINAQQATIRELSTPLMPLSDGIIMMPLVGTLDSNRAQQMMETLLNGIALHHASTAIIDITGMKMVDTQVAQALIHTTQAVKLLGAQVILTGIQPQIATTLVHLGADLSGIMTRNSLRSGIDYVFQTRAN